MTCEVHMVARWHRHLSVRDTSNLAGVDMAKRDRCALRRVSALAKGAAAEGYMQLFELNGFSSAACGGAGIDSRAARFFWCCCVRF